jgi:hypothetical protein
MREQINPANAYRLAQAWTLIECQKRHVEPPNDRDGQIVPSDEAHAYVSADYDVTDEIPVKPHAWWKGRI